MRHEFRAEINAIAEQLLQDGTCKTRTKAMAKADAALRCGAKTRKGTLCQCRPLPGKARCKFHGGASSGPKTAAGLARSIAAARAGYRRWRAGQAERIEATA
jgi:hypothetical protein